MSSLSNVVGNFNGQFIGNSSAKPIVGVCLADLYKGNVQQARVGASLTTPVYQGKPVTIKNQATTGTKAGEGLNPNVLEISADATAQANLSGFVLESPNMVIESQGSANEAPTAPAYAVTNVALMGSGVEIYLPADAGLVNTQVGTPSLVWDFTNKCVTAATGSASGYLTAISPVVDGLSVSFDSVSNKCTFVSSKVIKIKL